MYNITHICLSACINVIKTVRKKIYGNNEKRKIISLLLNTFAVIKKIEKNTETMKKENFIFVLKNFLFISALTLLVYQLTKTCPAENVKENKPGMKPSHKFCLDLYKKIRFPNKNLVFRPPLKEPPPELMANFTDNGRMPIKQYFYINDAYSDSDSDKKDQIKKNITNDEIDIWRDKIRKKHELNYGDTTVNEKMFKYKEFLQKKSFVVLGTELPWIESIAYEVGCSSITTLDYTRKNYQTPRLEWIHVNDYFDKSIENLRFEEFDNAASFSSIEHSGLGRYGDPLSPYGDLEAVQHVKCMLKPGGLFFLGLPVTQDG